MGLKSYRELEVWQAAMSLVESVYRLLDLFPREERFALCDQMRRSAVSVPSNIAEGFGRETTRDFVHFLSMARGSLNELQTQLELAERLDYIEIPDSVREGCSRTGRMLNALSAKLKARITNRQPPATDHEPRTTNHQPPHDGR